MSPVAGRRGQGLSALRHRDFRLLWISLLISQLGSWMQLVANQWLLLQLTNSPFLLGLQGLFTALPFIAGSLFGGALADRIDRRKLLQFTQLGLLLTAAGQGALVSMGSIQVWQIYLFGALNWTIGAFDMAGRQALVAELVPRSELSSAIALNSTLRRGTAIIGPAMGGLAVAGLGLSGAYWANAASYAPVILALALMSASTPAVARQTRSMGLAMVDGLRYAGARQVIAGLLGLELFSSIFASVTPLMAVFARDVLHVGAQGLGVLLSMPGVGALVGTGLLILAGNHLVQGKYILLTTILNPIAVMAFALSTGYRFSLVMLLLVGMFDMMGGALRNTAIQLDVEEGYRGRIMGLLSIASRGVNPLGGVQAGAIASLLSAPIALAAGGAVTVLWSLATALRLPQINSFSAIEAHPKPDGQVRVAGA